MTKKTETFESVLEARRNTSVKQLLLNARREILETKVIKEGRNKFSNYDYFTPSQITALVIKACINHNILSVFNLEQIDGVYMGKLSIQSLETDEEITFTIPTAMPDIKATNITQKLGGMVTYTQRYLEMIAFGITDNNLDLDSQDNTGVKEPKKKEELDSLRFNDAIDAIEQKKVKKSYVIDNYDLSVEQLAFLEGMK